MDPAVQLLYVFSILCVVFGLYILRMDFNNSLRLVFFLLCILIASTIYIAGVIYTAKDKGMIAVWERINFVTVTVCWAVNLNFYILLTEYKMNVFRYLLLYAPTAALILLDFSICHIVLDYLQSAGRWKYVYSPMYYVYMLYSISYCLADMTLVYLWGRRSKIRKYRLQAKMILGTMIPLWSVCIVVDYILSHFAFHKLLPIGPFGRMIYILVLWYSSIKYRFLAPASSVLLQNVVLNTKEIVVLIDRESRILIYNNRLKEISDDRHDLKKRRLSDFIDQDREFSEKFGAIVRRQVDYSYTSLKYKTDSGRMPTSTYLSGVLDNYGDLVGVLIVSRENTGVRQFRDRYKISERQMEIINLMLSGLSNSEISMDLGISKKTTEAHIFHIYTKLGIDNKIELYNFTAGFNMSPSTHFSDRDE